MLALVRLSWLEESTALPRYNTIDEKTGLKYEISDNAVKVPEKYTSRAWAQIEKSLDVVHLSRELASLRFLLVAICNKQTRLPMPTVMCLASSQIKNYDTQDGLDFSSELKKIKSGITPPTQRFGNELLTVAGGSSMTQLGLSRPGLAPDTSNPTTSGDQIGDLLNALTNELFPSQSLLSGSIPLRAHEIDPGQNSAVKLEFSKNEPREFNNSISNLAAKRPIQESKLTPEFRKMPRRLTHSKIDSTKRHPL